MNDYHYMYFWITARPYTWDKYPHLSLEDIRRKSVLEELYLKEEKTKQAKAETERVEAEAERAKAELAKSKVQLRMYELKAANMTKDRNYDWYDNILLD